MPEALLFAQEVLSTYTSAAARHTVTPMEAELRVGRCVWRLGGGGGGEAGGVGGTRWVE